MISLNKIWLFKTGLVDPFIFEDIDGLSIVMDSERKVRSINVETVNFFLDNVIRGVFMYETKYGGEDDGVTVNTGKSEVKYEIRFEPPNFSLEVVDELTGGEWSAIVETTGGDLLLTLARFQPENYSFENDQRGEFTLTAEWSNSRLYLVDDFTFGTIIRTIDRRFICNRVNSQNFIPIT